MGHSHRIVVLCLLFSSVMAIVNLVVQPVFSQAYETTTSVVTKVIVGYTTSTSFLTAITMAITSSSSLLTYVTMALTTSTSFLTYVELTVTSSTSTYTYPAPSFNSVLGAMNPTGYSLSVLCVFFAAWSTMRAKAYYTRLLWMVRRILMPSL
ncbi:MAG TPA: hypothetical protein VK503_04435 [Candidatus Bathyarchaeia archaeon]|nr:hypothetical protein [Candidatus Bathyarchaeia archaeon]